MRHPLNRSPLALTIKQDNTDGYTAIGHYSTEAALVRAGSINLDLTTDESGREAFQIELVDRVFRDHERPLRRGRPAIINLSIDGLFEVVQKCRMRWEEALSSARCVVPGPGGVGERDRYHYEEEWRCPVDAATFQAIAGKLALAGARMFESVFERGRGTPLDDIAWKLREVFGAGEHAITINAPDFHLPWRMLYTQPVGCEPLKSDGSNFDLRGFWGYQHILEEFTNSIPSADHVTADNGKVWFAAGLHERIDNDLQINCLAVHRKFVQGTEDRLFYDEWTKKAEVPNGLSADPFRHQIVYFLCHAEGAGSADRPSLKPPVLQISDGTIDAVEIGEVIRHRFGESPPLVFINACRGGHLGTLFSHNFTFVTEFLEQGAVCLIGPQIEVPAVFAGEFGKCFFDLFLAAGDPPPKVGDILRGLTRVMYTEQSIWAGL